MHRTRTRRRGQSLVLNIARVALVALVLGLSLTSLRAGHASATLCPTGMEPGPDIEVVNADGSVTRTPGPCVVKVDPGALIGGAGGGQIETDEVIDVNPS